MMRVPDTDATREAVESEFLLAAIAYIIEDTRSSDEVLRLPRHAALLFESYRGAGWPEGRIADQLISACDAAGVPIEVGRPLRAQAYGFVLRLAST